MPKYSAYILVGGTVVDTVDEIDADGPDEAAEIARDQFITFAVSVELDEIADDDAEEDA